LNDGIEKPVGRRFPAGAELSRDGVSFRVWAPDHTTVAVVVKGIEHEMVSDRNGYFLGVIGGLAAGARYQFRLDREAPLYHDPASRFQPEGPEGPSQVVDPWAYEWRDQKWAGLTIDDQVLYEMHVGTFTPQGTWSAAADRLSFLKDLGITAIEMMPINDFAGRFGWGYDGVDWFAPTRLYGTPDDLRAFVDEAHRLGMGIILDVVYNHVGPTGNVLPSFSKHYFTNVYENDWGAALNFDGANAHGPRDLVISNAAYWIEEFHFDGLRLDATQNINDGSRPHVIAELARAARLAARPRNIIIIAENEPQLSDLVRPVDAGGFGLDAVWNDDLHHSSMVAVTGRNEAYYEDHQGVPQEFISAAKYGYLFQGQTYSHQGKPRGMAGLDLKPQAFVTFAQNHDQVANSGSGDRMDRVTSPGRLRALTALLLLMPGTPMLFQGQEFEASTPFLFFADHGQDLAKTVRKGRADFLRQFPSLASNVAQARLPRPELVETFQACVLDWSEAEAHSTAVSLHRDLLALRRCDRAFSDKGRVKIDGSVLSDEAFLLRFFSDQGSDRLLLVNFGRGFTRSSIADPLIAPLKSGSWRTIWSSEDPAYGGAGTPPFEDEAGVHVLGHAALVLGAG
jgi:maltooligosyltrehalose trehalohydrolase